MERNHGGIFRFYLAGGIIVLHLFSCGLSQDTGLSPTSSAAGVSLLPDGSVRLVDGYQAYEGRVEVYYQGVWGTVCDEFWTLSAAIVLCNQLGYSGAVEAKPDAYYGQGSGPMRLDGLNCGGYENSIAACSHDGWSIPLTTCDHSHDAGAVCSVEGDPISLSPAPTTDGAVRLTGGTRTNIGRVEVYYLGQWGTICQKGLDNATADVICRQLGYISAADTPAPPEFEFGRSSSPIHLDDVKCVGTESKLALCSHGPWGDNDCDHSDDLTLNCKTYSTPEDGSLRLVDGRGSQSGQVQISYQGVWGTVCDDDWNINDASVVCRQLGYKRVRTSLPSSYFGDYTIPVFLGSIECIGSEQRLEDCQHQWRSGTCDHSDDVGVICGTPYNPIPTAYKDDGRVRLDGGEYPHHGRVEVKYHGRWGTVCDQGWTSEAAAVVCRQLGFISAESALPRSFYGETTKTVLLDDVSCDGTEPELVMCSHGSWVDKSYNQSGYASVVCTAPTPEGAIPDGSVRLVDGDSALEGRLELYYQGIWGTVCGHNWNALNSDVACKQLGYQSSDPTLPHYRVVTDETLGAIVLDEVVCTGGEDRLVDCAHDGWGITDCTHLSDVGIKCSNESSSPDTMDGSHEEEGGDEGSNEAIGENGTKPKKPFSKGDDIDMSTGLWILIILIIMLLIMLIAFITVLVYQKYGRHTKATYHTALPMEDKV
ncbi:deleted in malignant brain tumors 1 protein-like [Asterias rubens]|uniref:deleted in malignant brain tumors 1 protein-like n=1 Tax=Asterias rubens TaxID=7604 RepID=UPI0014550DDF|nr:deleted in malignant brain tumors 1 protein-like [Asterias rubens]